MTIRAEGAGVAGDDAGKNGPGVEMFLGIIVEDRRLGGDDEIGAISGLLMGLGVSRPPALTFF